MKRLSLFFAILTIACVVQAAGPREARAGDFCLQINGVYCDLSGDLGFFRLAKKLPTKAGQMLPLHGRAAGLGAAFGSATMNKTGDMIEVGVTFFTDAVEGQFNAFIDPANLAGLHSGYAAYGNYDVTSSCDVQIVDCALEP